MNRFVIPEPLEFVVANDVIVNATLARFQKAGGTLQDALVACILNLHRQHAANTRKLMKAVELYPGDPNDFLNVE